MSARVEISGEVLHDRIREFLSSDVLGDWAELFNAEWSATYRGNVAEREYWVDLYRRRQEVAAADLLGAGIADRLAVVVRELTDFEGDSLILFMLHVPGRAYFVWVSPDLSRVVSGFSARDNRSSAPTGEI